MFHSHSLKKYRGTASLEMVMIVVILLPLFVLVLFLQTAMMQKFNQSVNTKNEAWKKRYIAETASQESASSDQESASIKINQTQTEPFNWKNEKQGMITAQSSEEIQTGFLYDRWNKKTSSQHTLISGTWDYHEVKMDSFPNIKNIAPKIAIDAVFSNLMNKLSNLMNQFSNLFQNTFNNMFADMLNPLQKKAQEFKTKLESMKNDPFGVGNKAEVKRKEVEAILKNAENAINNLTNQLQELGFSSDLIQQFQKQFNIKDRIEVLKLDTNFSSMLEPFSNLFSNDSSTSAKLKNAAISNKNFDVFPEYSSIKKKIKNMSDKEAEQFLNNPKIKAAIEKHAPALAAISATQSIFDPQKTSIIENVTNINPGQSDSEELNNTRLFLAEFVLPKVWELGVQKDIKIRAENYIKEEDKLRNEPPIDGSDIPIVY
ncbi:MAG: hypothetical protein LBE12_13625 [Planctomycetaceae bacterium]|jgi:hypothetical protein|nr:hypothetical protein [Planctomycetaceae bacterium]